MSGDWRRLNGTFHGLFSSLFADIHERQRWGETVSVEDRSKFEKPENIFWRIEIYFRRDWYIYNLKFIYLFLGLLFIGD